MHLNNNNANNDYLAESESDEHIKYSQMKNFSHAIIGIQTRVSV